MAIFSVISINIIIILILTYVTNIRLNGYVMGLLVFVFSFYLKSINIKYFEKYINSETMIAQFTSICTTKSYAIIGGLLLVLSLIGLCVAGANYK